MNVLAQAPIDSTGWHRDPTQARKSGLDVLAEKSPAHYLHWCREEDRDTPALSFGSAFHCFVLEPKKFSERYAVAPAFGDLRFKDNKAKKAEFMETIGGRELVDADDYDAIRYMADAIHAHPTARNLIVAGQAEKEIRWTDAETGLSCGARLDFHIPTA
jgi:hypothetical protein